MPLPFFALLKEMTLAGSYTSEIGAARELQDAETAGSYEGDVSLDQVGRAYSRNTIHS